MFKLMHSLVHLHTAPLTLRRVVLRFNRKHMDPMCSCVLTPCIVEVQTHSIFGLAHATWTHKRAMHRVKKSGALHQAVVNMIKEPFLASNWKVLVPLPASILSAALTARVNVALPV